MGNLAEDIRGPVTGQFNFIGGTAVAAGLQTDGSGSPLLRDNGGSTPTIALVPPSPAINKGKTSLTTDQRGVARPQGSAADIGAYEAIPTLSVNSPSVREGNGGTGVAPRS